MNGRAFFTQTKRFWYVGEGWRSGEWKGDSMRTKRGDDKRRKTIIEQRNVVKDDASASLDFRRQKNGISFLLPHDMFSSLKCVLLSTDRAIRYGTYNTKDDISKDGVQGGPPGAVSLVRNRLIRKRTAVLSPSFVPFVHG